MEDETRNKSYAARPGAGRGAPSRSTPGKTLRGTRGTVITAPKRKTTKPKSRPPKIERRRRDT